MYKAQTLIVTGLLSFLISACGAENNKWHSIIRESSTREIELILDSIYDKDQYYRQQLEAIRSEFGRDSREMRNLWDIISYTDSSNLLVVKAVLDNKGWLGRNSIGYKANRVLFLVLQHADTQTQQKYLPMMRVAVRNGNAEKSLLAMLEDRVALRNGKKQIYGSQIGMDSYTGKYYVLPLENPDSVDQRRASMDLGKLQDYVQHYGIEWNVEEYKAWLIKQKY